MQQKGTDQEDVVKLCETFASNEASCTTASSDGESNARVMISNNPDRRGAFEADQEEEEEIRLSMDKYNPLIHKTTHIVNNMSEKMLFELLEAMFDTDEDLATKIAAICIEKGTINVNVEDSKENPPMEIEVKLVSRCQEESKTEEDELQIINFKKNNGIQDMRFYEYVKKVKESLKKVINPQEEPEDDEGQ